MCVRSRQVSGVLTDSLTPRVSWTQTVCARAPNSSSCNRFLRQPPIQVCKHPKQSEAEVQEAHAKGHNRFGQSGGANGTGPCSPPPASSTLKAPITSRCPITSPLGPATPRTPIRTSRKKPPAAGLAALATNASSPAACREMMRLRMRPLHLLRHVLREAPRRLQQHLLVRPLDRHELSNRRGIPVDRVVARRSGWVCSSASVGPSAYCAYLISW